MSQPTAVATLACLLACVSRYTAVAVLTRVSTLKDLSQGPAVTAMPERCHPMRNNMVQAQRLQHRVDTHCLSQSPAALTRDGNARESGLGGGDARRRGNTMTAAPVGLTLQSCRCSKIDDGVALTTAAVHITRTDSPQQQH